MSLHIRLATETDLPAMVAIKHDAGLAAWAHILPPAVIETVPFLDRWTVAIESPDSRVRVLVAETGRQVIGYAVTRPSGDANADVATGELDAFFVDPTNWGLGAGRTLMDAALPRSRREGFAMQPCGPPPRTIVHAASTRPADGASMGWIDDAPSPGSSSWRFAIASG